MADKPMPDDQDPVVDAPTAETPLPEPEVLEAEVVAAEPDPAPGPTDPLDPALASPMTGELPATTPSHAAPRPSVLDRVRGNRMGPLAAGLGVGIVVALLLAVLVPGEPNLYAFVVLGLLVTAAVGFTVRYLAPDRGWASQATAFVATAIAIHVMAVTGTVDGLGPGGILEDLGVAGPGFDDALLASFAVPAVSTGGVLSGLAAAIIAGWGPRDRD